MNYNLNSSPMNKVPQWQYTSYFERFNVIPTNINKLFIHYYMANLAAPSSEASIAYNAYKATEILDKDIAFNFYIPVYSNMEVVVENSNSGAVEEPPVEEPAPVVTPVSTIITSAGYKIANDILTSEDGKEVPLLEYYEFQ